MRGITVLLILLFLSCNRLKENEEIPEKYRGIEITENSSKTVENNIKYTLELPDTLKVNQAYDAVLRFESEFDTIVEPMVDSVNFRTIMFYYYNPVKIGVRNESRKLLVKDSVLIPNKEFVLGNVKFNEKGNYLFLALIEDEIMYSFYNNKGLRDSVHFDLKSQEIKKEVVVID